MGSNYEHSAPFTPSMFSPLRYERPSRPSRALEWAGTCSQGAGDEGLCSLSRGFRCPRFVSYQVTVELLRYCISNYSNSLSHYLRLYRAFGGRRERDES